MGWKGDIGGKKQWGYGVDQVRKDEQEEVRRKMWEWQKVKRIAAQKRTASIPHPHKHFIREIRHFFEIEINYEDGTPARDAIVQLRQTNKAVSIYTTSTGEDQYPSWMRADKNGDIAGFVNAGTYQVCIKVKKGDEEQISVLQVGAAPLGKPAQEIRVQRGAKCPNCAESYVAKNDYLCRQCRMEIGQ